MNLDQISWNIIRVVQNNARVSIKNLAHEIGLSIPATSERLKRLEEVGVIENYTAVISVSKVGYTVSAVISVTSLKPAKSKLLELLDSMPEVIECLHVTGPDSYLVKVVATDMAHLENLIESINPYGETKTAIVMSQPIPLRAISKN